MSSNLPAREQTAAAQLAALEAIGLDRTAVNVTNIGRGGDKVLIGTVGLLSTYQWFDRSPFFRADSEAIALEIGCSVTSSNADGSDFDFCLFGAISGQEGDTFPVNDTRFLWSDRWRHTDSSLTGDVKDRFVKMLPVVPGALYRLGALFIPGPAGATAASFVVYASGVTVS